ncbi:hypothetical protein FOCC_FOCC016976 [Frankliniella occidentalis]|nr:hypothetical protein FOCC_FOCC016976 [Frankliniella occidentalis]
MPPNFESSATIAASVLETRPRPAASKANAAALDARLNSAPGARQPLVWYNIVLLGLYHSVAVASVLAGVFSWKMYIFMYVYAQIGGLGVTAGVHRLWSHRAYKARRPLRYLLAVFFSVAGQNTILNWVRDHRVHHKFTETDADPHNAKRGFFFAHCGWLLQRKHPDVYSQGAKVDLSDVESDPVVQWHTRRINPTENALVSALSNGEGWHNYHHIFPWDYKASEHKYLNFTTVFLDQFVRIGWAYDLKSASPDLVARVALRHGDGSHPKHGVEEHFQEVPYDEYLRILKDDDELTGVRDLHNAEDPTRQRVA